MSANDDRALEGMRELGRALVVLGKKLRRLTRGDSIDDIVFALRRGRDDFNNAFEEFSVKLGNDN